MRLANVLALAALFVASIHTAPAAEPASDISAEWQPLHDRWQAAMQELHIPGLAVVAVRFTWPR